MWETKALLVLVIICYGPNLSCILGVSGVITLTEPEVKQICQGLEYQYVAHPTVQQNYIICVPGGGIEKECATTQCFNERNPPCSTVCNANTNAADQATKDYCKDDDTSLLDRIADEKDCQSYFICLGKNTDPLAQKCPPNQHFSEQEKTCLNYQEANCAASSKWCKKRRNGTRFPHANCHEYYECQNETTIAAACSYGKHFLRDLGKCVSGFCHDDKRTPDCRDINDGVRMTHPKCYKYYVCLKQSLFEAQCASGYYFDKKQNSCTRDINNVCNDI